MRNNVGISFLILGIAALGSGLVFGSIGAFQFIMPDFLSFLPFFKSRPLHVSLVVAWIFSGAIGGIYYYLPKYGDLPIYSNILSRIHFWIFLITGISIIASYIMGSFGGREYWEFHPLLSIPIIISWILFAFNFVKTIASRKEPWPIYYWMWITGIFFFLFSYVESNLWIFQFVQGNLTKEITLQWKSYGSLVGSWNMLIYGTAFFVMERISGDKAIAKSKLTFLMFFLGLINLMFNWAHHVYFVPSASWIRNLAYIISMTELLILGKIIWNWKATVSSAALHLHRTSFNFLFAADIWIFLNLALAILMSIPAINRYTHGTHITVAHAMGSTIGINTMILLASVIFIIEEISGQFIKDKKVQTGLWIVNISLFFFFAFLIISGAIKGYLTLHSALSFHEIMQIISPYFIGFSISGLGILSGLMLILVPAGKSLINIQRKLIKTNRI